jgi:hypothetical protein
MSARPRDALIASAFPLEQPDTLAPAASGRSPLEVPMPRHLTSLPPFVIALLLLGAWVPGRASQDPGARGQALPARYTAVAVRTIGISATQPIDITIQRWTTDAEDERLNVEMMEGGQGALLKAMRAMPDIGRVNSPGAVGFPLKVARRVTRADGAEEVTIITERERTFWEASQMLQSTDYPFILIEMSLDARAEGEGRVLVAVQLSYDRVNRMLRAENFENASVLLQGIRRLR